MAETQDKGSIGNYKGVMLCNRPTDPGVKSKPGIATQQFKSAVNSNNDPLSRHKLPPRQVQKSSNHEILNRHKKWLAALAHQKENLVEEVEQQAQKKEEVKQKLKEREAKRRQRALNKSGSKSNRSVSPNQKRSRTPPSKRPQSSAATKKLTEKNLKSHNNLFSQPTLPPAPKPAVKKDVAKPKWAMTKEQLVEEEEQEVEDLLAFAADLDYEQFMDDFEIRQAMEIVKERVQEMKKEEGWKERVAAKYNQDEGKTEDDRSQPARSVAGSAVSIKSYATAARVRFEEKEDRESKWDSSTVIGDGPKITTEDKIAKVVADQVLNSNYKFRGVHSNASIRRMLEKEAKREIQAIPTPRITTIPEVPEKRETASHLPHLYRNPAI